MKKTKKILFLLLIFLLVEFLTPLVLNKLNIVTFTYDNYVKIPSISANYYIVIIILSIIDFFISHLINKIYDEKTQIHFYYFLLIAQVIPLLIVIDFLETRLYTFLVLALYNKFLAILFIFRTTYLLGFIFNKENKDAQS